MRPTKTEHRAGSAPLVGGTTGAAPAAASAAAGGATASGAPACVSALAGAPALAGAAPVPGGEAPPAWSEAGCEGATPPEVPGGWLPEGISPAPAGQARAGGPPQLHPTTRKHNGFYHEVGMAMSKNVAFVQNLPTQADIALFAGGQMHQRFSVLVEARGAEVGQMHQRFSVLVGLKGGSCIRVFRSSWMPGRRTT